MAKRTILTLKYLGFHNNKHTHLLLHKLKALFPKFKAHTITTRYPTAPISSQRSPIVNVVLIAPKVVQQMSKIGIIPMPHHNVNTSIKIPQLFNDSINSNT